MLIKEWLFTALIRGCTLAIAIFGDKLRDKICLALSARPEIFLKSRYKVIQTNLKLCFPEKTQREITLIAKRNVESTLRGYLDVFTSWHTPMTSYKKSTRVENIDIVNEIRASGQGVLLLGGHFTSIDIAGIATSFHLPISISYRPHSNAIFDRFINHSRLRWANNIVNAKKPLTLAKTLKKGGILWYAPDQDFGRESSTFSPFFNIQTSTTLGIQRLTDISGAAVVPVDFYRDPITTQTVVRFNKPLSTDATSDNLTNLYNKFLETKIREHPDQYLWSHRRFKTRPAGEESVYQ